MNFTKADREEIREILQSATYAASPEKGMRCLGTRIGQAILGNINRKKSNLRESAGNTQKGSNKSIANNWQDAVSWSDSVHTETLV